MSALFGSRGQRRLFGGRIGGGGAGALDPDAASYITAVEIADGEALEPAVKSAINAFVVGCKADSIWSALKASCILAGARTLSGALVPLVGAAPTNFNFVSADYNRITGLKGNGSTKYLNTNRANDDDPQEDQHLSVWLSEIGTANSPIFGDDILAGGASLLYHRSSGEYLFKSRSSSIGAGGSLTAGFMGISRDNSANFNAALGSGDAVYTVVNQTPSTKDITLFRSLSNGVNPSYYNGRAPFFSAGTSLSLPNLRSRVTTLVSEISEALA